MTIASAIDEIIIAQGGTPDPTDTIEESIRNLGQYIGGGGTAIVVNDVEGTLDKTWKEIYDAVSDGSIIVIKADFGDAGYSSLFVTAATLSGGSYTIWTAADNYTTGSENGYPEAA